MRHSHSFHAAVAALALSVIPVGATLALLVGAQLERVRRRSPRSLTVPAAGGSIIAYARRLVSHVW
ncbi:MAG: hypothetical protein ACYDHD_04625 [Vulcanimicrobiaceae bacterium]